METKTIPHRSFYSYPEGTVLWLVVVDGKRVDGCFKTKMSAGKMVGYLLTLDIDVALVQAKADVKGDFVVSVEV